MRDTVGDAYSRQFLALFFSTFFPAISADYYPSLFGCFRYPYFIPDALSMVMKPQLMLQSGVAARFCELYQGLKHIYSEIA